jgi:hypothetical protein
VVTLMLIEQNFGPLIEQNLGDRGRGIGSPARRGD